MSDLPGMAPGEQLLVGLSRLGQAVRLNAWDSAGTAHLTPLQADIVRYLAGRPPSARQGDLVTALASTPPTVSDAVRTLAGKGLLERSRDLVDARAINLSLTPVGQAEADRLAVVPAPLRAAVDAMAPEDVAAMLRGATTMIRVLQEHRAIPVSRTCVTCVFYQPSGGADRDRPHHCRLVGADFADAQLRLDCPEHQPAEVSSS